MVADPIMAALEEQLGCYRRLAKLAEVQHEHVQQSEIEALLDVLGQRQRLLERIGLLEQTIGPARRRWSDYVAGLGDAQRQRAEGLVGESRLLLEAITTADRNDALVLQQRKLNLGQQIGQASAGRKVNRNYAAAAYGRRGPSMDVQR